MKICTCVNKITFYSHMYGKEQHAWCVVHRSVPVFSCLIPPPHRRHLARSLPVPRGSMHTGGFLSRLALSGVVGQTSQQDAQPSRIKIKILAKKASKQS